MRNKFLLVCVFILLSSRVYAQGPLQKNCTIKNDHTTLAGLLSHIGESTGVSFSYDSRLLDPYQTLSLSPGTYSLHDLLRKVFRDQGIDFIVREEHIILRPMVFSTENITLQGHLKDSASQQPLVGATVYFPELKRGAIGDTLGRFSLNVPPGLREVRLSLMGYKLHRSTILLISDTTISFFLASDTLQMQEAIINEHRPSDPVYDLAIGKEMLDMESVQSMPAMFGEVDVLKSIQMLPGIQSAGEGLSGLLVRGGSADQTLVMLNDATIYSPSHFLGFFSVFNPEAIKDVEVFKGGIPARWGGRLSSIVNNRVRKGDDEKFKMSGGIGLISSRLSVEGPILKNKASFLLSGRRTYFDLILNAIPDSEIQATALYFYDLNTSLHFRLNRNNQLRLFTYGGNDIARFYNFMRVNWGNRIVSGEWLHTFNPKLLLSTAFHYSHYGYGFDVDIKDELEFEWTSSLNEYSGRFDFVYSLNNRNEFSFGYNVSRRTFSPVYLRLEENNTLFGNTRLDRKHALEHALYFENEQQINDRLSFHYGLRYSMFHTIGPGRVFLYEEGKPKSLATLTDTLQYGKNELIQTYHGPEPRITGRYTLSPTSSLKFSYNRMQQFTQVASSATASMPTDRWITSDYYIKPQTGDQLSAGYFRQLEKFGLDLSAEVYYKIMRNQIDFKDGVTLVDNVNNQNADVQFNNAIETQVLSGKAWSYGLELMLRKKEGRFNGWISYTLSRTQRRIKGINSNKPYSPRYDRPHDISVVASYKISSRVELATNWVYTSGSAVTLPEGKYNFDGKQIPYYNPAFRNNQRLPDYHRLDLSLTLHNKKNEDRRWKSNWSFSIYNAYMRKNPLFIQFIDVINNDPNLINTDAKEVYSRELKGVKVFFTMIPAVSYNFKF